MSSTQIGYVGDNLMTPIQFTGLPKGGLDDCTVTVFMYSNHGAYKFVFEHSESIPVSMPLTI